MMLVELINTPTHAAGRCSTIWKTFVTSRSGARAWCAHNDAPNFIANRIGIAGMLATMKQVENFGLTLRRGG